MLGWRRTLISLAIGAGCVIGSGARGQSADVSHDQWYRSPNDEQALELIKYSVRKEDIGRIRSRYVQDAVRSLENQSWRRLTIEEAQLLTSRDFAGHVGKSPYLVRALAYDQPTAGCGMSFHDAALLVSCGVLDRHGVARRNAFVVFLPADPAEVYVMAGGAL